MGRDSPLPWDRPPKLVPPLCSSISQQLWTTSLSESRLTTAPRSLEDSEGQREGLWGPPCGLLSSGMEEAKVSVCLSMSSGVCHQWGAEVRMRVQAPV